MAGVEGGIGGHNRDGGWDTRMLKGKGVNMSGKIPHLFTCVCLVC